MNRSRLTAFWLAAACMSFAGVATCGGYWFPGSEFASFSGDGSSISGAAAWADDSAELSAAVLEESRQPVRKASIRKASRRVAKPRSVARSAPEATVVFEMAPVGRSVRPTAAVAVVNAADLSRLCRLLL